MRLFHTIDELLRGRLTRAADLRRGTIEIPIRTLAVAGIALGALYGLCMGLYAPLRAENASVVQVLATTAKVPLLFLLTLVVTYPSLYVVSALFDSRLRHGATLRLLLAAMTANLALLASLGPVTAFFTLCTESYSFMIVLNVGFFAVAGLVGLGFLRKALDAVFEAEAAAEPLALGSSEPAAAADPDAAASVSGLEAAHFAPRLPQRPRRPVRPAARRVFTFWTLVYGVVGAQMGWVLRPFIGSPELPFVLFRADRESNVFSAFFRSLAHMFT